MTVSVDFDELCAEAFKRTGIDGYQSFEFEDGLRNLLGGAESESKLTREGRRLLQAEVLRILAQRLRPRPKTHLDC